MAADAETLCCAFARSVVEVTRETTVLRGRNLRQSTFKDFHDTMNKFNNRLVFATVNSAPA